MPAEWIWQALVDERIRRQWWPELEFEPKVGARVSAEAVRPGKKKPRRTRGTVTEVSAPEELRFDWTTKRGDFSTAVRIRVSQQKHKAKLRVVETGFPRGDYAEVLVAECRAGWREQFGDLSDYLDDTKNLALLERRVERHPAF
nr:SRPBCC family protein [Pseudoclavibacter chungangensis]